MSVKRNRISQTKRQIIFARDSWTCCYCGKEGTLSLRVIRNPLRRVVIPIDENGRWFEIDHIIPVVGGGDNSFNNLITACRSCNNKKSSGDAMKPVWRMFVVDIK